MKFKWTKHLDHPSGLIEVTFSKTNNVLRVVIVSLKDKKFKVSESDYKNYVAIDKTRANNDVILKTSLSFYKKLCGMAGILKCEND